MKILITGCAGFLGFHLCQKILEKKNYKVIGIDNLNSYYSVNYKKKRLSILKKKKNFKFYKLDISNFKELSRIFKEHKVDFVVNFAAQAGVRYSITNPLEYANTNILGFFNIVELCRKNNIKKIYYASSSSVYGEKSFFPISENHESNPKNIYSLSKKNNEDVAEVYSKYYGMQFIGLRFFTVYGEWGRPDMLIIKYILHFINKKNFLLNNYGDHYRDFTYVGDVVENILILFNKKIKKKHEIFNICSNNPINIKFILKILDNNFGKPRIIKVSRNFADVYKTHGSNKKIVKVTQFKNYLKIEEGLRRVINWAKENIKFIK